MQRDVTVPLWPCIVVSSRASTAHRIDIDICVAAPALLYMTLGQSVIHGLSVASALRSSAIAATPLDHERGTANASRQACITHVFVVSPCLVGEIWILGLL